jgi:hypothetical protein
MAPPLLADFFGHIGGAIAGGIGQTLMQVLLIGGPLVGLTIALHYLEVVIQGRLARRWGWNSVMFTGWAGTPVHELSHAALCPLFFHTINKVALFEPDQAAGRLGYVNHSYCPDGWKGKYAEMGNFFIGTAPLMGGTAVLLLLLWIFYPASARTALQSDGLAGLIGDGRFVDAGIHIFKLSFRVLEGIVRVDQLGRIQFWAFLYLTLCVGSHMAPSASDYRGARGGAIVLLLALLAFNLLWCLFGGAPGKPTAAMAGVLSPAIALFGLAVVVCGLNALVVVGITELYDGMTGRQQPG